MVQEGIARGWRRTTRRAKDTIFGYSLMAPVLLLVVVFLVFPIVFSAVLSLTQFNLARPEAGIKFVGLHNYLMVINRQDFRDSFVRTLYFSGMTTFWGIVLGLAFALVLNQPFLGRSVVRALIIVPWAVPAVINGVMWRFIYSWQGGALTDLVYSLGFTHRAIAWLSYPFLSLNLVILADLWKRLPFIVVIFMAALTSIPEELIDSARIDGANARRVFWNITLPLLRPSMVVLLVLCTAWSMQAFDLIYAVTQGGPAGATRVLPYYTFVTIFSGLRYGEGAAIGYFITIFIAIVGIAYVRLFYREVEY
jgi:multiple sugar transport system permease protein